MSERVLTIVPRGIRLKDAPRYLGMDKNSFNRDVRPFVNEIKKKHAVTFDRLELDNWFDEYKRRNGRSALEEKWNANYQKDSSGVDVKTARRSSSYISRSSTGEGGFAALAEQLTRQRRKDASA